MAESYIEALSGDYQPEEFADNYREALEQVIAAKAEGHEIAQPEERPAAAGQVVDLMDALRRSVAEAKARRGEPAEAGAPKAKAKATKTAPVKKTTAAKKAPAKKTAASQKSATKAAPKKPARTAAKKARRSA